MFKNISEFFKKHYMHLALIIASIGIILIVIGPFFNKKRDENQSNKSNEQQQQQNKETKCIETDCFPYKCKNTSECATNCVSNSDCISTHSCVNSRCVNGSSPQPPIDNDQESEVIWDLEE